MDDIFFINRHAAHDMMHWLSIVLLLLSATKHASEAAALVTDLTTEYLDAPLGVDVSDPRLSWKISHLDLGDTPTHARPRRGVAQTAYHIEVSESAGFDAVSATRCDGECGGTRVWDCGVRHSDRSNLVPLSEACVGTGDLTDNLRSDAHYHWRVTVTLDDGTESTACSTFHTGLLSRDDWRARWITGGGGGGGGGNGEGDARNLLRSEFLAPPVESHATLFVSGIGYHEVYLNGERVGDRQLDPGWTDYTKRIWYSTHDISLSLSEGINVVGVSLGNGWWSCGGGGPEGRGTSMPNCADSPPQLLLQLQVDGRPVLVTDADADADDSSSNSSNWTAASGPITYDSLYNGEVYDARIAERIGGWTSRRFDPPDGAWTPAATADSVANDAIMSSQLFEPIRRVASRRPVGVSSPSPCVRVFDFGQNQAAVVQLGRIFCDRGARVTLRHAELLNHPPYGPRDGNIYVKNLRGASATDVYICRGDPGGESYVPTFTQHGFRYVEVSGLGYPLKEEDLEAVELHSDLRRASSIEFSHPLLNKIQSAVVWGQKSNLMSVPTDCDQRDERRGWMGDAALTAEEAAHNFGMGAFYSRWLVQIVDAQGADGSVPNFVPPLNVSASRPGSPNWQSAFPTIVWVLQTHYGDSDVAVRYHDSLTKYFGFFERRYNETGMGSFMSGYGDWVPPPPQPKSDGHLVGAFAFLHDLRLGAEIFASSSHPDAPRQARRCNGLLQRLSEEYHDTFYNTTTGVYKSGLQTEQALPLSLNIVPEALLPRVVSHLLENIQVTNNGHLTCGIVGAKFLMEVLTTHGHSEVALDLALQTTYPSWGYMMNSPDEPATTVWELWNSDVAGPGMNSRNHIMFGSVGGWFYRYLAGIRAVAPGFSVASIRPTAVGHSNLTGVDATVATPHGDIRSRWKVEGHDGCITFRHVLHLPPNTHGTLAVPIDFDSPGAIEADSLVITESGFVIWSNGTFIAGVSGVLSGRKVGRVIELHLTNGGYEFTAFAATLLRCT